MIPLRARTVSVRVRVVVAVLGAALLAGCSSSGDAGVTTVTVSSSSAVASTATSTESSSTAPATTSSPPPTSTEASSQASSETTSTSTVPGGAAPGNAALPQYPQPAGDVVSIQPSGFVVTRLPAGAKPPQFVVVSFDGVGWHEKWQYWKGIQTQVPFHFTGFLSGTYLLSDQTKTLYTGPGHSPGKASISWATPADLPVQIDNLNDAYNRGDEIGTHFNGHFCTGAEPGANDWTTADWNNELDQFFSFMTNVGPNNGIDASLDFGPSEVIGGRTPCLEGTAEQLFPAYLAHNMVYDSSFPNTGIMWPEKSPVNQVWRIGMATFPIHGMGKTQIMMDYNFYYAQRGASSAGVSPDQSAADSQQVLDTYRDMYGATFDGNRAPLILGNHFNDWNNNAYSDAIGAFVTETCGKPDTFCVTNRDLVAWLEAQDPAVLASLQAQPAEMGPR